MCRARPQRGEPPWRSGWRTGRHSCARARHDQVSAYFTHLLPCLLAYSKYLLTHLARLRVAQYILSSNGSRDHMSQRRARTYQLPSNPLTHVLTHSFSLLRLLRRYSRGCSKTPAATPRRARHGPTSHCSTRCLGASRRRATTHYATTDCAAACFATTRHTPGTHQAHARHTPGDGRRGGGVGCAERAGGALCATRAALPRLRGALRSAHCYSSLELYLQFAVRCRATRPNP